MIGDGEVLSLGAQTNGTYYQSYNMSYSTNWFGGKRPIQFSVGAYFSKQSDVSSNYYNNGYLFYSLHPTEVNIVGDSIDLEMRIFEGPQAHINHVRIMGNDRLYENVIRRELRTKPGDLFSKEALQRSAREIASMGHFDPEKVNPDVKPDPENGTLREALVHELLVVDVTLLHAEHT